MPQAPVFTVISVTKDNLAGLQATARSLNAQTYKNFEWLVIDGASSDGTLSWLKDTHAHVTSEPDAGIYDAMNKGLERANGIYVLFLNAGDRLAGADTLEMLAAQAGPDFIYGDSYDQGPKGMRLYKPAHTHANLARGMFTHHQAMLYRRAALNTMRYNIRYRIAADYDFTCRFLKTGASTLYIPLPFCVFEPGGISEQNAEIGRREEFAIRKALKLCSSAQNLMTSARQKLAQTIKSLSPGLYLYLRKFS